MERFVLIDLSLSRAEPTRVTAYQRDGWRMRALRSKRVESRDAYEVAHVAAQMCSEFHASPLIEEDDLGAIVLAALTEMLGKDWTPNPPVLRTRQL